MLLIPLTFALFTPLGLPAFAWWAAALNALPMIAAMAWVCADAILLVRTGNQRYALTGIAVFFLGLLFFEKAAVIPFVAFAVDGAAGATCRATESRAEDGVARRFSAVDRRRWRADGRVDRRLPRSSSTSGAGRLDLGMTGDLLVRSVTHGIVPGLVGGPWDWERWAPSSPWATAARGR